jgi:ATP-dependent helicase HrpA
MALGALKDDLVAAALDRAFLSDAPPMRQADFAARVEEGRNRLSLIAQELQRLAAAILAEHAQVQKRIAAAHKAWPQAAEDVRGQCARLLAPRWLARTPWERLQHLPRYLKAAGLRLEKLRTEPGRDERLRGEFHRLQGAWQREMAGRARQGAVAPELEQFGWLLEELRVSLFAQQLGTPVPVSVKRLAKLWQSMKR